MRHILIHAYALCVLSFMSAPTPAQSLSDRLDRLEASMAKVDALDAKVGALAVKVDKAIEAAAQYGVVVGSTSMQPTQVCANGVCTLVAPGSPGACAGAACTNAACAGYGCANYLSGSGCNVATGSCSTASSTTPAIHRGILGRIHDRRVERRQSRGRGLGLCGK